jgi:hypothetical protein
MRARLPAALAVYAAVAVLLFGRDVLAHPTNEIVGDAGADKTLYLWAFEWWPWAIRRGLDPLHVTVDWIPHGFDLGLGTAGGGLALLAWPLTTLAGPVAAYNVLALAAPALAAAAAFALSHLVTNRFWPSLVGGWIFGFSSYEQGHLLGHLPLAFDALVPLAACLVLLRAHGSLSARSFVAALALVLAAQFLIVTQVFFSLVLMGGIAAGAALLLYRRPVRRIVLEAAGAAAAAVALVSPVLVYALVSHAAAPARSPFAESADVLSFVVPTRRTWLRPPGAEALAGHFTGTGAELGAYLGLPFVALVVLALRRPRSRDRLLLVLVLGSAAVLSLGTRVKVAGVVVGIAPWTLLARLPLVGSALPVRLTLYTSLLAGLLVALALAERPSRGRWALAACGVVATLPNLALPMWHSQVPRPAFFARGASVGALPAGANVLVLPYGPGGWSMLWQAEAQFRFRMVGGHFALRVTPQERPWRDVYTGLNAGRVTPKRLRAFLAAHCVDRVVVAPGTRPGARRLVAAAVPSPPLRVRDALVYVTTRRRVVRRGRAARSRRSSQPDGAARPSHELAAPASCRRA